MLDFMYWYHHILKSPQIGRRLPMSDISTQNYYWSGISLLLRSHDSMTKQNCPDSFADRVFQTEIRVIQSRQNCPLKKRHLVLKCSMIINHWLKFKIKICIRFKIQNFHFFIYFLTYRNILLSVTQPSIWSKELSLKQSSLKIRTTNAISWMYLGGTA